MKRRGTPRRRFCRVLIVQSDAGKKHALKMLKADLGIAGQHSPRSFQARGSTYSPERNPSRRGIVWHEGEPFIVLPAHEWHLRNLLAQSIVAKTAPSVIIKYPQGSPM